MECIAEHIAHEVVDGLQNQEHILEVVPDMAQELAQQLPQEGFPRRASRSASANRSPIKWMVCESLRLKNK